MHSTKEDIIARLRQDILTWEGFRPPQPGAATALGLGPVEQVFPNQVFPTGTIHEFISECPEDTAACGGFVAALAGRLLQSGGVCLWISWTRRIYPPALKAFGIDPDRIIFIDVPSRKDVLWVTEEALKCEGVATVISETNQFGLAESRRLQLAVERSHVTGFVLRKDVKAITATAAVARWKVVQQPSQLRPGMPGVGFPRWQVELLKVKNGLPGKWILEWRRRKFVLIQETQQTERRQRYA
jgi:protein ImuA